FRQRILVQPQHLQLTDDAGTLALDQIGRYETLQQSYDRICERIGIPTTELARKNPSQHAAYTDYYDDELRGIVGEYYSSDLELFGYDFAPSEPTN
ncbi:MAG: sulfotransferase, partial [Gammaproteobacteria bacterium]|nr:sulfotransferase [Gammaproteobacteria bacterium]